ncbi:hypothetical protein [Pelagerythrobacter sp.]|uniref:hypothetical protein n=1 Tax=Pelagerythrobacter sp. TaxID=2800702 RepID=UPI0035AFF13A
MVTARKMSIAQQSARRDQLDRLRVERGLTDREAAEADWLSHTLYLREYRAQRRERFGHADALRRRREPKGALA